MTNDTSMDSKLSPSGVGGPEQAFSPARLQTASSLDPPSQSQTNDTDSKQTHSDKPLAAAQMSKSPGRPKLHILERQEGNLHLKQPPPLAPIITGLTRNDSGSIRRSKSSVQPPSSRMAMSMMKDPPQVPDDQLMALYQHRAPKTKRGLSKSLHADNDPGHAHAHPSPQQQQQHQHAPPPPPGAMGLHRQSGTLNISGHNPSSSAAAAAATAKTIMNKKMSPVRRMMHIHHAPKHAHPLPPSPAAAARPPPFPVSQETMKLAERANFYNRKQRQEQRKLKEQQQLRKQTQLKKEGNNLSGSDEDQATVLDLSAAYSDDLGDDSIIGSPSFALANKVLHSDITNHSTSTSPSARARRHSVMPKDLVSVATLEPNGSIAGRRTAKAALAGFRRGVARNKSKKVIEDTLALTSVRRGLSANGHQRPALMRGSFTSEFSGMQVTFDKGCSTHSIVSSIGYNPASYRSLENSAHLSDLVAQGSGELDDGRNVSRGSGFSPKLQTHEERESKGNLNDSATSLDINSAVSPPTRKEFEERQSRRTSVKVIRSGDDESVASRASPGLGMNSTRRGSGVGAGLRRTSGRPSGAALGRRPSRDGGIHIPLPKLVDSTKLNMRNKIKRERDKERSELWGDILNDQNDIIMRLALQMSKSDTEPEVTRAQQQPELHTGTERSPSRLPTVSVTTLDAQPDPWMSKGGDGGGWQEEEDIYAALQVATEESKKTTLYAQPDPWMPRGGSGRGLQDDSMDAALQIAIEESKKTTSYAQPDPWMPNGGSGGGWQEDPMDAALQIAIEESKKIGRPGPVRADSDRELELILAVSRLEAEELDRRRHAGSFTLSQGSQASEHKREKLVPLAPLESNAEPKPANSDDAEAEARMDLAKKLSKQEHDFEISRRPVRAAATGEQKAPREREGSALEYSVDSRSLIMPSEILDDDDERSTQRRLGMVSAPAIEGGPEAEAFALAIAQSKIDSTGESRSMAQGSADMLEGLTEEDMLVYALELSRRTPGARASVEISTVTEARSRTSVAPSASPPRLPASQPADSEHAYPLGANYNLGMGTSVPPYHYLPHPGMLVPPQPYPCYFPYGMPMPPPQFYQAYPPVMPQPYPNYFPYGMPMPPRGHPQPHAHYECGAAMESGLGSRSTQQPSWADSDDAATRMAIEESLSAVGRQQPLPSDNGYYERGGVKEIDSVQPSSDDDAALRLAMAISRETT